jgi:2-oxoisovalerate dehydrogenase E2 component (dihydrolipoyl transacylase)
MAERVFNLPDLGEGLEEAEIVEWKVAEGDTVELNQPLVEVNTAKAVVEIPSPFAGKVLTLHGAGGDVVKVGRPLVTIEVEAGAQAAEAGATPEEAASEGVQAAAERTEARAEQTAGPVVAPASGRPGWAATARARSGPSQLHRW